LLNDPFGKHDICLQFTGVEWSIYVDDRLYDNDFAIGYPQTKGINTWKMDGTKMEMDEEPIEMDIRDAIPGLALAIKRMTLGAEWEVYVPWQLAYGAAGEDKVKPFSTLIFRVKLITFR
jgi:hypothetical protein